MLRTYVYNLNHNYNKLNTVNIYALTTQLRKQDITPLSEIIWVPSLGYPPPTSRGNCYLEFYVSCV